MRKLITVALIATSVTVLAQSAAPARGSKLTPVNPFPGSTMTWVYGINVNNVIVGGYFDSSGVEHGFYGPLNGNYTSFDYGGDSTVTEGRAISALGEIDGYAPGPGFVSGAEFLMDPNGTITTLTKKGVGTLDGIAQGFNKRNVWVGDYLNPATGLFTGYRGKRGHYAGDIDLGFKTEGTSPRAINGDGAVSGWFIDTNGLQHGFLRLSDGSVQVIDLDDSGTTVLEGLNNHQCIVGQTTDPATGAYHSFVLDDTTGQASQISVPGSTYQRAWGISNAGLVALYTDTGSYILGSITPGKKGCPSGGEEAKGRIMSASEFALKQRARRNDTRRMQPILQIRGALP